MEGRERGRREAGRQLGKVLHREESRRSWGQFPPWIPEMRKWCGWTKEERGCKGEQTLKYDLKKMTEKTQTKKSWPAAGQNLAVISHFLLYCRHVGYGRLVVTLKM